ncbi:hypothetical protein SAMN05216283_1101, partial [Sunxiuqinia elliptica]
MKKRKLILILLLVSYLSIPCFSQEQERSWEELRDQYEFPSWYTEARFGI